MPKWTKKRDPLAPAIPTYKHPDRCHSCGHLRDEHGEDVGCEVEGGTQYIEDETGNGKRVCSCEQFVPLPEEVLAHEKETNAIAGGR